MKRYGLFLTILLVLLSPVISQATVDVVCFDGEFIRGTGTPVTVSETFPGISGSATIRIYNGGAEDTDTEKVSSSTVSVN